MNDDPLRVVLEREVELPPVRLRIRDWPGHDGPLVHLSTASTGLIDDLAPRLAPRWRVLSVTLESSPDPAISAQHVVGFLDLFGFRNAVLLAEEADGGIAGRVAQWCPDRVRAVLPVADSEAIEAALEACQVSSR